MNKEQLLERQKSVQEEYIYIEKQRNEMNTQLIQLEGMSIILTKIINEMDAEEKQIVDAYERMIKKQEKASRPKRRYVKSGKYTKKGNK